MLWKLLSIFSAACLIASCYFAWVNQQDLNAERARESFAKANVKAAQDRAKEAIDALASRQTALESAQKELAGAKDETVKLSGLVAEKENSLGLIKGNLDQLQQNVSAMEKQIEEAGDVEKLVAQIENLKRKQKEAEGALANQTQRLADIKSNYDELVSSTAKLRETEARGRRGIVDPEFTARVAQFFPEWDVAILNKGNTGGVFANADLEVKRGKQVIAKLKVKNVEQYGSVAEVIPGSLASGLVIQNGDTVVAVPVQAAPDAPAAATEAAPAAPAAPATTAPAAAPMSADPFGAPAAPAAAPSASDPFGAAPAPAAAAPAAASDPFGAAPAPAPAASSDPFGAAPATPGTTDKPNMNDPFGAAPAKP
jgi:hypothetical protein